MAIGSARIEQLKKKLTLADAEAAERLGSVYRYLLGERALPLDIWAIPNAKNSQLSSARGSISAALSYAYKTDSERGKAPASKGYLSSAESYKRDYDRVIPQIKQMAQACAQVDLVTEQWELKKLLNRLQEPGMEDQLQKAAGNVFKKVREATSPEEIKLHFDTSKITGQPELPSGEQLAYLDRVLRRKIAAALREEKNELLAALFMHPRGTSILLTYSERPKDATKLAIGLIQDAIQAADQLLMELTAPDQSDHIWRYPMLISQAMKELGLLDIPGLARYVLSVGQILGGDKITPLMNFAGLALFCLGLVFTGPVAAVIIGLGDFALASGGTVLSYLREREQELGAEASTFRAQAEQFATNPEYLDTALAGAAALLSGLAFFKSTIEFHELLKARPKDVSEIILPPKESAAGKAELKQPSPDSRAISGGTVKDANRGLDTKTTTVTRPNAAEKSLFPKQEAQPVPAILPNKDPAVVPSKQLGDSTTSKLTQPEPGSKLSSPPKQSVEPQAGIHPLKETQPPSKATGEPLKDNRGLLGKQEIEIPTKEEVEKAIAELQSQLRKLEAEGLETPEFKEFYLSPNQARTFSRLTDNVFTSGERAIPAGVSVEQAALLRKAEAEALKLRRRLAAHWDAALPQRGKQTAAKAAFDLLEEIKSTTPTASSSNQDIRDAFFNNWRKRFLNRVAKDETLIVDLEVQAGITFNRHSGQGGSAFRVLARDEAGRLVFVNLDIDHAVIRHEDAVLRALRTNDSTFLISTVDSANLQLMTARENQHVIEKLRALDRKYWSVPQGPTPQAVQPFK